MKIAFDWDIFIRQRYGGISRYFYLLANNLDQGRCQSKIFANFSKNEYISTNNHQIVNSLVNIKYPISSRVSSYFSGARMRKWRPDIVHETFYGSSHSLNGNCKRVITIHDMIHELNPEYFPLGDQTIRMKKKSIFNCDHIICVSNSTREDLLNCYSISDKKVTVIAIIIPKIPNKFPCLDVSGEERPLKARINNIPEIK